MNIEVVSVGSVKKNPNNPRIIKDDKFKKLVQSIKDFPEMLKIRPIVVNSEMIVLGGNMRFKACKEAGLKKVHVIIADSLTEEQQREFIIKDNVSGGEWDWEQLSNEWNAEQICDWGLDVPILTDINEEKEEKEAELVSFFKIEIECTNEEMQEKLYNEMLQRGIECRLLTF